MIYVLHWKKRLQLQKLQLIKLSNQTQFVNVVVQVHYTKNYMTIFEISTRVQTYLIDILAIGLSYLINDHLIYDHIV